MKIAIEKIRIGKRYRKDLGDLGPLVASLGTVGLLQPVVVDSRNGLIAGQRRIEAARRLDWTEIEAIVAGDADDALHLLTAQCDENTCRKDFAPSEAVAVGAAFEARESKAAKQRQAVAGPSTGKGKKRSGVAKLTTPMKGRANAKVATAVGMKRTTYEKAKAVVQAAKDDPKRFGPLLADMDRTGKVDRAYSKVRRAGKINAAQAPTGKYRVLYADPPWHRGGGTGTLPEDATRRV